MSLKTTRDELPTLNLTPMIDVVFLLIIFFMVGTKFAEEERKIDVQVPSVGQAAAAIVVKQKSVVNVLRDGTVLLDEQQLSLRELTNALRQAQQASPGIGVTVRGDAEGSFQNVASVLSACRAAGVKNMAISVRIAPQMR
jgi:biopolymer transport protein ExbD